MSATRVGLAVRKRSLGNLDSRISERTTENPSDGRCKSMRTARSVGKGPGRISETMNHREAGDCARPVTTWAGQQGTARAVVFRGTQTLSCVVIMCIEALGDMEVGA